MKRQLWTIESAQWEDDCSHCAYPFDLRDKVLVDEDGRAFCSRFCWDRRRMTKGQMEEAND